MIQLPATDRRDGVADVLLGAIREYDTLAWCKKYSALDNNKVKIHSRSINACFICASTALFRAVLIGDGLVFYRAETSVFFREFISDSLPDEKPINDEFLIIPTWNDNLPYPNFSDEGKAHVVETLNAALDYLTAHANE